MVDESNSNNNKWGGIPVLDRLAASFNVLATAFNRNAGWNTQYANFDIAWRDDPSSIDELLPGNFFVAAQPPTPIPVNILIVACTDARITVGSISAATAGVAAKAVVGFDFTFVFEFIREMDDNGKGYDGRSRCC